MFLKKVSGPRTVTLPDGRVLSRADLPARDTRRWVASRKKAVVDAVVHGLISAEEAMARYELSPEELASWIRGALRHGPEALKATAAQRYRQPRIDNSERRG